MSAMAAWVAKAERDAARLQSVRELKAMCRHRAISTAGLLTKDELIDALHPKQAPQAESAESQPPLQPEPSAAAAADDEGGPSLAAADAEDGEAEVQAPAAEAAATTQVNEADGTVDATAAEATVAEEAQPAEEQKGKEEDKEEGEEGEEGEACVEAADARADQDEDEGESTRRTTRLARLLGLEWARRGYSRAQHMHWALDLGDERDPSARVATGGGISARLLVWLPPIARRLLQLAWLSHVTASLLILWMVFAWWSCGWCDRATNATTVVADLHGADPGAAAAAPPAETARPSPPSQGLVSSPTLSGEEPEVEGGALQITTELPPSPDDTTSVTTCNLCMTVAVEESQGGGGDEEEEEDEADEDGSKDGREVELPVEDGSTDGEQGDGGDIGCRDRYPLELCQKKLDKGACADLSVWAVEWCRHTCGACHPPPPPSPSPPPLRPQPQHPPPRPPMPPMPPPPPWLPTGSCVDTDGAARCRATLLARGCEAAAGRAACARTCNLCAIPNNRLPNLEPISGAWRGSTLDARVGATTADYERQYGARLQLYRTFRHLDARTGGSWPAARLTADELAFVRGGGILWYNLNFHQPGMWGAAAAGYHDRLIAEWAAAVASAKPARVFVCLAHEADNDLDADHPDAGAPDKTVANYLRMWARTQAIFGHGGASNAVWAMDYSTHAYFNTRKNVAPMWPANARAVHVSGGGAGGGVGGGGGGGGGGGSGRGAGAELAPDAPDAAAAAAAEHHVRVDWLFFNLFLQPMRHKSTGNFGQMLRGMYDAFTASALGSAVVGAAELPWGIGAFGVHHLEQETMSARAGLTARAWQAIETRFMAEMGAAVASGNFSRLKALVYYDAGRSAIANKSEATAAQYKRYLRLPTFDVNDNGRRSPGCPAVCSEQPT